MFVYCVCMMYECIKGGIYNLYMYTDVHVCTHSYVHIYMAVCMYEFVCFYVSFSSDVATSVTNVVLVKASYLF